MFSATYATLPDDQLIAQSLTGNKKALEQLIKRHQHFVYNISLKLFLDPDDALDATQEVLIKVVTGLQTFKGKSQFRTWLYRIAFNHFLNRPASKTENWTQSSLEALGGFADEVSEGEVSEAAAEEVRVLCATAMLMCLNREQRLLYIVGEVFGADHTLGAELFGVSPANYRVKLHRAKADLLQFVTGRCGLVNPANPCRCPKKAKVLLQRGVVDKDHLRFTASYQQKISHILETSREQASHTIRFDLKALFQESPFQIKAELDKLVHELVR